MATPEALMGLGMAPELARKEGFQIQTVTTSGTTQGSGTGVMTGNGNRWVLGSFHAANGALTLSSSADIGDIIVVVNITANAADIFPPTGGNINQLSANASAAIAANASVILMRTSSLNWSAVTGAAAVAG